MLRKRPTGPGVSGPTGPVRTAGERAGPARVADHADTLSRVALEHRRIAHRPTVAQLRMMAGFHGRAPSTYRLDAAVNWLPEALPVRFPHGADGLCFTHPGGEVVVLPDGCGFALG
jgi:hypothetical protein